MKTYLLIFLLLFAISASAEDLTYTKTVKAEGVSAEILYEICKDFFKKEINACVFDDELRPTHREWAVGRARWGKRHEAEDGTIGYISGSRKSYTFHGSTVFIYCTDYSRIGLLSVWGELKVTCKEGAVEITISNLNYLNYNTYVPPKPRKVSSDCSYKGSLKELYGCKINEEYSEPLFAFLDSAPSRLFKRLSTYVSKSINE